jgi:hypothetical protein
MVRMHSQSGCGVANLTLQGDRKGRPYPRTRWLPWPVSGRRTPARAHIPDTGRFLQERASEGVGHGRHPRGAPLPHSTAPASTSIERLFRKGTCAAAEHGRHPRRAPLPHSTAPASTSIENPFKKPICVSHSLPATFVMAGDLATKDTREGPHFPAAPLLSGPVSRKLS